jgi:hypothetical protein
MKSQTQKDFCQAFAWQFFYAKILEMNKKEKSDLEEQLFFRK